MEKHSLVTTSSYKHIPVLTNEVIESLKLLPNEYLDKGLMMDATLGGGGHSGLILSKYENLQILGIDQDASARKAAGFYLQNFKSRIKITGGNFADFSPSDKFVFILADLGVSSHQLDDGNRGFSFTNSGPLDMRMNSDQEQTAASLIQSKNEKELADLIYCYGEERFSRKIAKKIKQDIAEKGPYKDTLELAYAIRGCFPKKLRYKKLHPATKTFQALRIAVNKELDSLTKFLQSAPDWLESNGLIGIISFHSLEDRIVKKSFLNDERLENITRKPIKANQEEISKNIRSRSAKFRIAKRKDL